MADECTIEDWTHTCQAMLQPLTVEGVTTRKSGRMQLRLHEDKELVGIETTLVEGYVFETIVMPVEKPEALVVKYNIDAE